MSLDNLYHKKQHRPLDFHPAASVMLEVRLCLRLACNAYPSRKHLASHHAIWLCMCPRGPPPGFRLNMSSTRCSAATEVAIQYGSAAGPPVGVLLLCPANQLYSLSSLLPSLSTATPPLLLLAFHLRILPQSCMIQYQHLIR